MPLPPPFGGGWLLFQAQSLREEELKGMLLFARELSSFLENRALTSRLAFWARTDGLTGLDNRRCFLEKLDSEMVRVKRYAHSQASVLMADIDFFKRVNDTHGHAAGDAALLHVAKLLRGAVRQSDTVGRLGGEEFAVLLPETSMGNAEQFAQRVCAMLRETPVQVGEIVIPLTISIGVTTIAEVDQGPEQILNRADLALYEAKRRGRDRVVSNHDAVQPSSNTADFSI